MKRLFALMLCLCVMGISAAVSEEIPDWFAAENAKNPSYLLHFVDAWPAELLGAVEGSGYEQAGIVDGYAVMRFGKWSCGQVLLQQDGKYVLGAFNNLDGAWVAVFSAGAVRQDAGAPTLLPEAVEYQYDDYQVSQCDGSTNFKLVYADGTTYRFFHATDGWWLTNITKNDGTNLFFGAKTVKDNVTNKGCYNVYDITLAGMDVTTLPTSFAVYREASDATPQGDRSMGQLYIPVQSMENYEECRPYLMLRSAPNASATVIATVFDGVEVQVTGEQGGFLQVQFGNLSGWMESQNVLRGSDRASRWTEGGMRAQVYLYNGATSRDVYAGDDGQQVIGQVQKGELVFLQAIPENKNYVQVLYDDGKTGWMRLKEVCMTDNMTSALVHSDDATKRLNLRVSPSKSALSLGKYYAGTSVTFLYTTTEAKGWAYVGIEGKCGWVMTKYLNYSWEADGGTMAPPLATVRKNRSALYMDSVDGVAQGISCTYDQGTKAEVLGIDHKLAHVRMQDGRSGYMALSDLGGEPKTSRPNRRKLQEDVVCYTQDGTQMSVFHKGETLSFAERTAQPLVYAYTGTAGGWVDSTLAWQ